MAIAQSTLIKNTVIKNTVVGSFQCNCRLIVCPKTLEAALVDPGDDAPAILSAIKEAEKELRAPIRVKALFHTHGHLDHVGATRSVKEALGKNGIPAEIFLHRGDEQLYLALNQQGALFGVRYDEPLAVDQYFEDEQELKIGELKVQLIHTPGHSPGSVCLRLREDSALGVRESLFAGDTLFQGSVGRTDLWGGDQELMFRNIKNRILTLDDETRVCPGHGPDTWVGVEKRTNPFLI